MATMKEIFDNTKLTENGDSAYKSTGNTLIDILFMSEYFKNHLDSVPDLDDSMFNKLFAMFIRDPRYGLGLRDLGRVLMKKTSVSLDNIAKVGRYDDVWSMYYHTKDFPKAVDYLYYQITNGDELAKKWMPRYSSKNKFAALAFMKFWNMNKKQYSKFIKADTVESKMSSHNYDDIIFEQVPSLAMLKYFNAWNKNLKINERFFKYLEDVKNNKKDIKIATSTVYDIYRNSNKIDCDLFFDKIEKISGSWIPILDTSASMNDMNDSYGKATSVAHYLAKCSSYLPDHVISFSQTPCLLSLKEDNLIQHMCFRQNTKMLDSNYKKEIYRMYTGDCANTDLGKVMDLVKRLDKSNAPEYFIVLSDMEFDIGSSKSKDETMKYFKDNGFNTKIIWWNFNSRATTSPETDEYGNLFMSGYNPLLLKYLSTGFNAKEFLYKLIEEYYNIIKSYITI